MSVEKTVKITHKAEDATHGMTLDELAAFVEEARAEGVDGSTTVKTTSTWRQSIKRIEVQG
jgi:hypothetical protein